MESRKLKCKFTRQLFKKVMKRQGLADQAPSCNISCH